MIENMRFLRVFLILALVAGISLPVFSQLGSIRSDAYQLNKAKWWGFALTAGAGFVDGIVEGYEFDGRRSWERKYGVSPDHPFWGSNSWKSKNTAWEKNFGVFDFYHVADDLRKIGYISGGIVIGIGGAKRTRQKPHHYFYDFALSFAISGAFKAAGMYYIRRINGF